MSKLEDKWGVFKEGPTKTQHLLYPPKLLKNLFTNLSCHEDDYLLMEWLYQDINTNMVTNPELMEIIFICVIGNDSNDVKFVSKHGELCERCGWCCKNCKPIKVRPDEVPKIGSMDNLEIGDEDYFIMKVPCIYQNSENKCTIYDNRPDSCETFPISVNNGSLVVQRDINCYFIYNFLINKVYFMINKVYRKKKKQ